MGKRKTAKCPVCGKRHRVRRFKGNDLELVICPKLRPKND